MDGCRASVLHSCSCRDRPKLGRLQYTQRVRCSVPDLCQVGQEIRRRTPSCSPRAEEGCADSGAVGGKRAGSFRSLTPLYRRYPLWPPPQPTPSRGLLSLRGTQAPLSCTNRRRRTWPHKRGCSLGSLLACGALPAPPFTTAPDAQCTVPRYAQYSAMRSTQSCQPPRSFSTLGRTRASIRK